MEKIYQEQIRDIREGFTDAQAGKACEMRNKSRKGCLKNAHRTFEQGIQCVQVNSVNALVSIQDSVMIVHAPDGCSGCAVMGASERINIFKHHRGDTSVGESNVFSTGVGEKEIILGGENRLQETVREAIRRHHPKMAFVLTSCSSAIIGDDIDSIVGQFQEEYPETRFVPVHCEGFKSRNHATGYDLAFNAIQNYIIKDTKRPKEKGLINLFATHSVSWNDQQEMRRMLKAIGLEVNILPYCASYEDLMKIPAAEYNISVCQIFGDEYMKFLNKKYGTPYTITCMPIGTKSTDRWLRGIAELVGKEVAAEAFIKAERAAVADEIALIRKKAEGLKVCITAGTGRGLAAATLIGDYGMKLLCMHTPYYEDAYVDDFEELEKYHGDKFIINVADMQPFEQINLIKKLKPDLFIGMANWASRLGIPTTHILDSKRPTFGYRGVLYLGRKIEDALDNNNFNAKLNGHVSLPFREEWYQEDPFKYVEFPNK